MGKGSSSYIQVLAGATMQLQLDKDRWRVVMVIGGTPHTRMTGVCGDDRIKRKLYIPPMQYRIVSDAFSMRNNSSPVAEPKDPGWR
jgi:hypothetical protein